MPRFKVIRISFVEASNKHEAMTKVKENPAAYWDGEFAVEVEQPSSWIANFKRQLLGKGN